MQFFLVFQNIVEEIVLLEDAETRLFSTDKGKQFLNSLFHQFPECSFYFEGSTIICAALDHAEVEKFLRTFKSRIVSKFIKVIISYLFIY